MIRTLILLAVPLVALSGCNVERDAGNDTTTFSIDENQVEGAVGEAGNALQGAAGEVREAATNAAPALENAASDIGNAAAGAGRSIENGADRAAGEIRAETRDNPPAQNRQ